MPLVVYFDEVGNPTMEASDKDFPVFAVVLLVTDADAYRTQLIPRINKLKFDFWGHEGVILHSRDIRKAQGDFAFLKDPTKRQPFYDAINDVMLTCEYNLIPVAIRKDLHAQRYRYPADPYDLSLLFALERLLPLLERNGQKEVVIIAERRGKNEDRELHLAFQRIVSRGTEYYEGHRFRAIKWTLRFLPKSMNIVGTQVADLAAYPVARYALDPNRPNPAFDVIRPKFLRGFVKIFP
ncbi:MAG: DUF3800 domain-containing protein [Acidobacteria bacterium]|nr:DUF3800 domain-containing protein [Acidobacteriota bacterium]